jgi:hypothetical protein
LRGGRVLELQLLLLIAPTQRGHASMHGLVVFVVAAAILTALTRTGTDTSSTATATATVTSTSMTLRG